MTYSEPKVYEEISQQRKGSKLKSLSAETTIDKRVRTRREGSKQNDKQITIWDDWDEYDRIQDSHQRIILVDLVRIILVDLVKLSLLIWYEKLA